MKNKNNCPIYYLSEAAQIVHANISEKLKAKYDCKKIKYFLELEDDYYDEIGLNVYLGQENSISYEPIEVDEDQLSNYIICRAAERKLNIEEDELAEILRAELIYHKIIGEVREEEEEVNSQKPNNF